MTDELEFLQGDAADEDSHTWQETYNRKPLFESASALLYIDGSRVRVPRDFRLEVDRPKGKKGYYPVTTTLPEDFLLALTGPLAERQEVTVHHRVDGETTTYRVREVGSRGRLHCEVTDGEPLIWKRGKRVRVDQAG